MAVTTTIENFDEKQGLLRRFLGFLLYPIIAIWRLLFVRNIEDEDVHLGADMRSDSQSSPVESEAIAESWTEMRLEICERLWGDGCLNPFNSDYLVNTLRLLDMNESNSLLQLGAGLGGTSRSLAEQIGIWVTGFEANEDLMEIAKMRNQMAGLTKKAGITRLRPEAPKFKENGFNAAILFECLTPIEEKEIIIESAAKSLRENGHFLMTDYVLPSGDPPNEIVMCWYNREPEKPKLWTARRTYDTIKDAGLEVRIAEDFTAKYRTLVLTGWLKLLSGLSKKELTPDFAAALIWECEFWIYRIAALDSGGLKVYRYHAIKENA